MNVAPTPSRIDAPGESGWLGTAPIPAAHYYDPAYFELERNAVFRRTWLLIGHISELPQPGAFIVRRIEIANASILLTHGKDGVVRAFYNVCTHRGTELVAAESGTASSFSCRYHSWTFGNDGAFRSAPDFERFFVDKADCNLRPIAAEVCGGLIFVNLAKTPAQGLREFLGPFADQLDASPIGRATTFTEYVYDIAANWKVNYDNFQENYHLRFIHPVTGAPLIAPENPFGYPTEYAFHGPHRSNKLWKNPRGFTPPPVQAFAFGKSAAFAAADAFTNAKVDMKLFPNLFVVGQGTWIFTHLVMPISVTRTRGTIRIYWIGEDDSASRRFAREFTLASIRDVHAEDRGIIEQSQRGISTGAVEHIHFQEHEVLCRHFHHTIDAMVRSYQAEVEKGIAHEGQTP